MLLCCMKTLAFTSLRNFSTSSKSNIKVTVCGASGGIGQPLSLLLKLNTLISELSLYDIVHTPGVAADLSHIDRPNATSGYKGRDNMKCAMQCSDIVVITAGMPRKPGMERSDLFKANAEIVQELTLGAIKYCPKAWIAIVTNPLNSCVPIAAELQKKAGCFDPNRLFGIFSLDHMRARTFVAEKLEISPEKVKVPVVGGHSGVTILPVFSQCEPKLELDCEELENMTKRVRDAGTEVVKAKAGAGSATLSMAHAGALFVNSLLRAMKGEKNIIETAYVESNVTEAAYFSNPLRLGPEGVTENLGLPKLNEYEQELLKGALPELKSDIEMGVDFVKSNICLT